MTLTLAQMLALLPDNTTGDITAQDLRDVATALYGTGGSLIEEQVLGSDTATVNFTDIPGTYKNLKLEVFGRHDGTANDGADNYGIGQMQLWFGNGSIDTGSNYDFISWREGSFSGTESGTAAAYMGFTYGACTSSHTNQRSDRFGELQIWIPNYADSKDKTQHHLGGVHSPSSPGGAWFQHVMGYAFWRNTAAITHIRLEAKGLSWASKNWKAGSTFRLWGVNTRGIQTAPLRLLSNPLDSTITVSNSPSATYPDFPVRLNGSNKSYAMLVDGQIPDTEDTYQVGYIGWLKGTDFTTTFWVKIDLGAVQRVSRAEADGRIETSLSIENPDTLDIEYSTDDSSWSTFKSWTGLGAGSGTAQWKLVESKTTGVDARYIRYTFGMATATPWLFLANVAVWG